MQQRSDLSSAIRDWHPQVHPCKTSGSVVVVVPDLLAGTSYMPFPVPRRSRMALLQLLVNLPLRTWAASCMISTLLWSANAGMYYLPCCMHPVCLYRHTSWCRHSRGQQALLSSYISTDLRMSCSRYAMNCNIPEQLLCYYPKVSAASRALQAAVKKRNKLIMHTTSRQALRISNSKTLQYWSSKQASTSTDDQREREESPTYCPVLWLLQAHDAPKLPLIIFGSKSAPACSFSQLPNYIARNENPIAAYWLLQPVLLLQQLPI